MSHHSYQPTRSCGSKLLQQKWDRAYYNEHRRLVKSAKPMVDTTAPPKPPHVIAKWKKQQLEKERAEEIERDNQTLMLKMNKIMHTTHTSQGACKHHSLNDKQRQRELDRVARENKEMLQRLQSVKPVYRISDWIDDWQRSEELTQRITAYPSIPTGRSKSAPHGKRPSPVQLKGGVIKVDIDGSKEDSKERENEPTSARTSRETTSSESQSESSEKLPSQMDTAQ